MENHHFQWVNPLFLWVMFNSYVKLPEGITNIKSGQNCSKCSPLEARAMSLSLPRPATAVVAAPLTEVDHRKTMESPVIFVFF
jgi:hypothetical protein